MPQDSLAGFYRLRNWLMRGPGHRSPPGSIVELSHVDATAALAHGTASPVDPPTAPPVVMETQDPPSSEPEVTPTPAPEAELPEATSDGEVTPDAPPSEPKVSPDTPSIPPPADESSATDTQTEAARPPMPRGRRGRQ
jgi:hypothetical protein